MFDLTQAIKKWRSGMLAESAFRRSDVDELQAHVLDTIDDLESKGLSKEEAFMVALHRTGDGAVLREEYVKAQPRNPLVNQLGWAVSGFLLITAIQELLRFATLILPEMLYNTGAFQAEYFGILHALLSLLIPIFLVGGVVYLAMAIKGTRRDRWLGISNRIIGGLRTHSLTLGVLAVFIVCAGRLGPSLFIGSALRPRFNHIMYLMRQSEFAFATHAISMVATFLWPMLLLVTLLILERRQDDPMQLKPGSY